MYWAIAIIVGVAVASFAYYKACKESKKIDDKALKSVADHEAKQKSNSEERIRIVNFIKKKAEKMDQERVKRIAQMQELIDDLPVPVPLSDLIGADHKKLYFADPTLDGAICCISSNLIRKVEITDGYNVNTKKDSFDFEITTKKCTFDIDDRLIFAKEEEALQYHELNGLIEALRKDIKEDKDIIVHTFLDDETLDSFVERIFSHGEFENYNIHFMPTWMGCDEEEEDK